MGWDFCFGPAGLSFAELRGLAWGMHDLCCKGVGVLVAKGQGCQDALSLPATLNSKPQPSGSEIPRCLGLQVFQATLILELAGGEWGNDWRKWKRL